VAFFSVCSQLWQEKNHSSGPLFSISSQLWAFALITDMKSPCIGEELTLGNHHHKSLLALARCPAGPTDVRTGAKHHAKL
jgi:hypothetical protein